MTQIFLEGESPTLNFPKLTVFNVKEYYNFASYLCMLFMKNVKVWHRLLQENSAQTYLYFVE